MEITKSTESYTLKDTLDNGWAVTGDLTADTNNISMNIQVVNSEDSNEVGNIYWNRGERINFSVNCPATTANTDAKKFYDIVDSVLAVYENK